MAIGILGILFYTVSILGFGGLILLYIIKNEKVKNILFYFLSILGIIVSFEGFISAPTNDIVGKIILAIVGILPILAIIVKNKMKLDKIAYILVTITVIVSILKTFSII